MHIRMKQENGMEEMSLAHAHDVTKNKTREEQESTKEDSWESLRVIFGYNTLLVHNQQRETRISNKIKCVWAPVMTRCATVPLERVL